MIVIAAIGSRSFGNTAAVHRTCRRAGVKVKSIKLALGLVRGIVNLSARLWRDEHGLTWLENAPLVQLLPGSTAPYPLDWEEQRRLLQALPDHLPEFRLHF